MKKKKEKIKKFGFCYVTSEGDIMKNNRTSIMPSDKLQDKDTLIHLINKYFDKRLFDILQAYFYACKLKGIDEVTSLIYYDD